MFRFHSDLVRAVRGFGVACNAITIYGLDLGQVRVELCPLAAICSNAGMADVSGRLH